MRKVYTTILIILLIFIVNSLVGFVIATKGFMLDQDDDTSALPTTSYVCEAELPEDYYL